MKRDYNKKAFTLMEIVVVVIILGVIAGLALPRFGATIERMRASEGAQVLVVLLGAQKRYELENGSYATAAADLDVTVSPTNFNAPNVFNDVARVATLQRSTNDYTLQISETGIMSCVDGGTPTYTCAQVGY